MIQNRSSKIYWLLLVRILVFVGLACCGCTAKGPEVDSPDDAKSEKVEIAEEPEANLPDNMKSEVLEMVEEPESDSPDNAKSEDVDKAEESEADLPAESESNEVVITEEPEIGSTKTTEKDGMEMLCVPAGEFDMGPAVGSDGVEDNEKPHTVNLDAYWIDKTEVTNAMFAKFADESGYETQAETEGWGRVFDGGGWRELDGADWQHPQGDGSSIDGLGDHPVVQVSWNDAAAYCEWAGKRLPSEAEWEKAARGTDGRIFPWGNEMMSGELLNYGDLSLNANWSDMNEDDGYIYTAPVGSYPLGASPYGALDMAGNVWEMTNDWYAEDYYEQSPADNPQGPSSGEMHVFRGGSWSCTGPTLSSEFRVSGAPDYRHDHLGFRCVLSDELQE